MSQEFNLHFQNAQQVTIHFAQKPLKFILLLTAQDRKAIRHDLEAKCVTKQ